MIFDCSPHAVERLTGLVQRGYMGKTPRKLRRPTHLPLLWHRTCIELWRDQAGMTQQQVADALAKMQPPVELDRVSIQRIEKGMQRPKIMAIEAMAELFGTDVTSLLNRTPEEARDFREFEALAAPERRRLLRILRAATDEGERQ